MNIIVIFVAMYGHDYYIVRHEIIRKEREKRREEGKRWQGVKNEFTSSTPQFEEDKINSFKR